MHRAICGPPGLSLRTSVIETKPAKSGSRSKVLGKAATGASNQPGFYACDPSSLGVSIPNLLCSLMRTIDGSPAVMPTAVGEQAAEDQDY